MQRSSFVLNASQRQRLLITCKHIDRLLADVEQTLHAAASRSVFPNYVSDIGPRELETIQDRVDRLRQQLLRVLARQSLAPEQPHISATHSIHVNFTFVEIAIAELAPRYMRSYGPVSKEGEAELESIIAELQPVVAELLRISSPPPGGDSA